jgi:hypothetical protein
MFLMHILPRNFEGLLKGTKKSVGDIGEASVGFCGGGIARFSKSMKQTTRTSLNARITPRNP